MLRDNDFSHMLFYGQPGTGKTTTAMAFANQLDADYVELNASNKNSVEDMRETVIPAMRQKFRKHKVIFLDEFDTVSFEAQHAIRRPLERYQSVVVIVSCNEVGRVHWAVRSRLMELEFKPIPKEKIAERLREIRDAEDMNTEDYRIDAIAGQVDGDLRKAVSELEKLALRGSNDDVQRIVEKYKD